ncbi:hypothetical protein EXIGLDRAFT_762443 [Exidia glandulosa HHB12029]|uniref:4Fe-4S ferredoxin-type domain-containing protein n=1 Tax=Exidia glandulosa HHB12029 TaxID=1314781 RepID=A0A165MPG0_EXIGL|nr:hypothetical protein EXIGLDRAFT_762443 [Exidia glandulosa HHB12029]
MRLILLLVLLVVSVVAKPRGWGMMARSNSSAALLATRTASAIQARQVTRERLMSRVDKTIMQNLFGRLDCSIPEPSALGCQAECPGYTLCDGAACYNFDNDPDHCGSCDGLGTARISLNLTLIAARATTHAMETSSAAAALALTRITTSNTVVHATAHAIRTWFWTHYDIGGACLDTSVNQQHCGACNNPCPEGLTCCGECIDTDTDYFNCGECSFVCDELPGGTCSGGSCSYP